jgi:hypothetical protein
MTDTNHIGDLNEMVGDAVAKCESCGVPWAEHMGIMGVCATNAQLRKERDAARRERDLAILLNEIDEIGRLRIENAWHSERDEAIRERDEARRERDYARREVCWIFTERSDEPTLIKAQSVATDRGWDCFKEETQ